MIKALIFIAWISVFGKTYAQRAGSAEQKPKCSPALLKALNTSVKPFITVIASVADTGWMQKKQGIQVVASYAAAGTYVLRLPRSLLDSLLKDNSILFADIVRQPKEELTTGELDLSANSITLAHAVYNNINGGGITASIKEQFLDTADIDIRGRYIDTKVAAPLQTSHAAIMATILAGGGNTSPFALGVAPAATVTSSSFASLLPDADSVYRKNNISLQNHSYGTGIENFYGSDARAYDISAYTNPLLLHVFSAGNSGINSSTSGAYSGIASFANLTGSFKMAKNILTVGHTDSFRTVLPLSSRGPAYDGRVAPHLVAFGQDGSSGAAALVSGSVALLQQAYKGIYNQLPPSELVKALLINGADEAGAKGIDYIAGYGALNTYAALQALTEKRFWESTLPANTVKDLIITIPQHTAQVKLTLCWTDTAAAANAAKALVNDLDMSLQSVVSGETWLPWGLSSYPASDSLLQPARRKKDTLNTIEQITVDNPPAGAYTVHITAGRLATANQPFAIAYSFGKEDSLSFIYPAVTDILRAGAANLVRWHSAAAGTAELDYAVGDGPWINIATGLNAALAYFRWNVPDTMAVARLRLRKGPVEIVSDTFVISKTLSLQVGFDCPDSVLLFWNGVPAPAYRLYALGERYLLPAVQTTDTAQVLPKAGKSLYYSVAPLIRNKEGAKSFTINYTEQGAGCYTTNFLATLQDTTVLAEANIGTVYNVAAVSVQKLTGQGFVTLQSFPNPSGITFTVTDNHLQTGVNQYRLAVTLKTGQVLYSDIQRISYFSFTPVIVYPNPVRQNQPLYIIVQNANLYTMKIFDAGGRLLLARPISDFSNTLSAMTLSKGLYFLQIFSDSSYVGTQKLLVE